MNKSKRFKTKLYGVTDANQSEKRGRQEQSSQSRQSAVRAHQ